MFLDQLNNSNQKESFMKLAYWVATADGSLGLPDIKLMEIFGNETGVNNWRNNERAHDIPQVCSVFPDELSRKITFSNLLALSLSEEYENPTQAHVVEKIREALAISPSDANEFRDWMKIIKGSCSSRNYRD